MPSPNQTQDRTWIARLALADFRNYCAAALTAGPDPVALIGANGAGKTNCLEAISLLTAGRGLRALPFSELSRKGGHGGWAVSADIIAGGEATHVGTGIQIPPGGAPSPRTARTVKIDHEIVKGSTTLARHRMIWLTPAMDSLFTGPASERRRFLDRLSLSLDPNYATQAATFDRAMRQRNRALEAMSPPRVLDAVEAQMAEAAARLAAIRFNAVQSLISEIISERYRDPNSPFPWEEVSLAGHLEAKAGTERQEDVRDGYALLLAQSRDRDRAAGRTLSGPHRSDLEVAHGPKSQPARICSTGEQKALLAGLVLAQARLIKKASAGQSPLILLDEIAAHLDLDRRLALFIAVAQMNAQVWMTGTDKEIFAPLRDLAAVQFFLVSNGSFATANDAESSSKP